MLWCSCDDIWWKFQWFCLVFIAKSEHSMTPILCLEVPTLSIYHIYMYYDILRVLGIVFGSYEVGWGSCCNDIWWKCKWFFLVFIAKNGHSVTSVLALEVPILSIYHIYMYYDVLRVFGGAFGSNEVGWGSCCDDIWWMFKWFCLVFIAKSGHSMTPILCLEVPILIIYHIYKYYDVLKVFCSVFGSYEVGWGSMLWWYLMKVQVILQAIIAKSGHSVTSVLALEVPILSIYHIYMYYDVLRVFGGAFGSYEVGWWSCCDDICERSNYFALCSSPKVRTPWHWCCV